MMNAVTSGIRHEYDDELVASLRLKYGRVHMAKDRDGGLPSILHGEHFPKLK